MMSEAPSSYQINKDNSCAKPRTQSILRSDTLQATAASSRSDIHLDLPCIQAHQHTQRSVGRLVPATYSEGGVLK